MQRRLHCCPKERDISFQKMKYFSLPAAVDQTQSGQQLCAVDAANETMSMDQLETIHAGTVPSMVPPQIHCAWRCTTIDQCLSASYRQDLGRCDFYYFTPKVFRVRANCMSFKVDMTLRSEYF